MGTNGNVIQSKVGTRMVVLGGRSGLYHYREYPLSSLGCEWVKAGHSQSRLGAMICANRAGIRPAICRHPLLFEMLHRMDAVDRLGPTFAVSVVFVGNTVCRSQYLRRPSPG